MIKINNNIEKYIEFFQDDTNKLIKVPREFIIFYINFYKVNYPNTLREKYPNLKDIFENYLNKKNYLLIRNENPKECYIYEKAFCCYGENKSKIELLYISISNNDIKERWFIKNDGWTNVNKILNIYKSKFVSYNHNKDAWNLFNKINEYDYQVLVHIIRCFDIIY